MSRGIVLESSVTVGISCNTTGRPEVPAKYPYRLVRSDFQAGAYVGPGRPILSGHRCAGEHTSGTADCPDIPKKCRLIPLIDF